MTIKKTVQTLIIVIIAINIIGCNSSTSKSDKADPHSSNPRTDKVNLDKKLLTLFQKEWNQMRLKSNKLVLKRYYLNPDSNISRNLKRVVWTDSTIDSKKISYFSQLFTDAIDGGYCCCPYSYYSVSFYKDSHKLGVYFVDTSITKGKAMFFDGSYQTSYFIDLKDWKAFIQDN